MCSDAVAGARASSLLETMVAMTIMLIILSSTVAVISFGATVMGKYRRHAEAERIAASHMESLLRLRSVPSSGSERFSADGRVDAGGPYVSSWQLQTNRPIRSAGRLVVTVADGAPHEAQLVTYILMVP